MIYKRRLQSRIHSSYSITRRVQSKMIYWLIPYLVAYNASSSGNWKYGPEHVFKVEVRTNLTTTEHLEKISSNIDMYIICRPVKSNSIQCSVESPTVESLTFDADGTRSVSDSTPPEKFENFRNRDVVFQVEFDEVGISKLWILNSTDGSSRLNMIRAILGTIHSGVNLSAKKYQSYTSTEKSAFGICETIFYIGRKLSPGEKKLETVIDGYSFDVPALKGRSGDEPIVIEKNRNMHECSKKTPYFFGTDEFTEAEKKSGSEWETRVTSSSSLIHLGRKSFSAHTRNTGTVDLFSPREKSMRSVINTDETIRLSLVSIRAAKEELRNTGNSANVGAGLSPGIAWPERNGDRTKFFM